MIQESEAYGHHAGRSISNAHAAGETSPGGFTVEWQARCTRGRRGRKRVSETEAPLPTPVEPGNVPRIARLMALALRYEGLIRRGDIQDYASLARFGLVSRARITQIMNLLNLAPDIQEEILFLPRTLKGRDPITERDIRSITAVPKWVMQRRMWSRLKARLTGQHPDQVGSDQAGHQPS